jgi:cytochrome P450
MDAGNSSPATLDFRSAEFIADPYPSYARLRSEQPLWREPHSGHLYVSRYSDIKAILLDERFISDRTDERLARLPEGLSTTCLRRVLHDRLMMTDGDEHRAVRRQISWAFTAAQVRTYTDIVRSALVRAFSAIDWSQPVDVLRQIALPVPSSVILTILGFDEGEHESLREWTDDFYAWLASGPEPIEHRTEHALHGTGHMYDFIRRQVDRGHGAAEGSLLAHLVAAADVGSLTTDQVVANLIGIVNAAHETTTSLMLNGLVALLRNPASIDDLIEHPELVPSAVDEMARYDAPAQIISRLVVEPTELGGIYCERGTLLALILASGNRDELAYTHPDEFDIRRDGPVNLSYGHGSHFCAGTALAKLEAVEFFTMVLPRLRGAFIVNEPVPWRPTPAFRTPDELMVQFAG